MTTLHYSSIVTYFFRKLDALFEIKRFEQMVCYLHSALTSESPQQFGIELPAEVLKLLQQSGHVNEDKTFALLLKANDAYAALQNLINNPQNELQTKILTRNLSLLASVLLLKVLAEVNPVDHVEKCRLKVEYIEEDVRIFDSLLSAYYMCGLLSGTITGSEKYDRASDVTPESYRPGNPNRDALKKVHPYCKIILEMKEQTADRVQKYASGNTFRPLEPSYTSFVKDCKHFTKSVLSTNIVVEMCEQLIFITQVLFDAVQSNQPNRQLTNKARTMIKQVTTWLFSVQSFYKLIEATYSEAFPDLSKPLQMSLSQIAYSVTSMNDLVKELLTKVEQGPELRVAVTHLMKFPNVIPSLDKKKKHLNRFMVKGFMQLLERNVLVSAQDNPFAAEVESLE